MTGVPVHGVVSPEVCALGFRLRGAGFRFRVWGLDLKCVAWGLVVGVCYMWCGVLRFCFAVSWIEVWGSVFQKPGSMSRDPYFLS